MTMEELDSMMAPLRARRAAKADAISPVYHHGLSWHQIPYAGIPRERWMVRVYWQQQRILRDAELEGRELDRYEAFRGAKAFVKEEDQQFESLNFRLM